MTSRFGPLDKLIGTPWAAQTPTRGVGGVRQPAPDMVIAQQVTVTSRFSANPGVLVSGRRPERPGG